MNTLSQSKFFKLSPLCLAMALISTPWANAQETADSDVQNIEEIVVTGFRESLARALAIKRGAANNMESIVAEDMGKMPDLNLAESLQRVPGVAITRESGEGRQVTVRGLGPDFTRATLNGMEVPGSTGGLDSAGGINRGRAVDFNLFASDIFSRVDLHKSAKASLEEGGLASTIDLHTASPLNNPGPQLSVSVQGTVDNIADETDPRFTIVAGNTFLDDKFGVMVSFAHSERTVQQEGFGSVRWTAPVDNGRDFADTSNTVINGTPDPSKHPNYTPGLDRDPLSFMTTPRLPRMDSFNTDQERTGWTVALEAKPTERLRLGVDLVGSKLEKDQNSFNFFAQFRNLFDTITPTEVTIDPNGQQLQAGTFENVKPRSESRGQFAETDFLQGVFTTDFDISENSKVSFMYGFAESEHDEQQFRFNMTAIEGHTFSFDFGENSNIPEMSYDFDITDPSQFEFTGPELRDDFVDRENETIRLDFVHSRGNATLKTGFIYNNRLVDSLRSEEDTDVINIPSGPVSADLTQTVQEAGYGDFDGDINPPDGFPRNWIVNDFAAATEAFNIVFIPDLLDGSTWQVEEETWGVYGELDIETELLNLPLRINTGLRQVQTKVDSRTFVELSDGIVPDTASSDYNDLLPSTNIVWNLRDDLLLRTSFSRNFTRPGLSSLAPSTDFEPLNGTISRGNPNLDPIRADSTDISLEWYFGPESVLALTYFRKDIDGFITGVEETRTLDSELRDLLSQDARFDPNSNVFDPSFRTLDDVWDISQPINGEGAKLEGVELAYQLPFYFLPSPFNGFGIMGNYTFVEAEGTFDGKRSPLPGLSEESFNLGFYYENERFGARVDINDRDDFITGPNGGNGNAEEATTGPTRVDASAFVNLPYNLKLTLEAINLTEEEERNFVTGPAGDLDLVREFNSTGREIYLGIAYSF